MSLNITIEQSQNPNALKFVLDRKVKTRGKASFTNKDEAKSVPMAHALMSLDNVTEVLFFDCTVTVVQDGSVDWSALESPVKHTIITQIETHSPDFAVAAAVPANADEALAEIEKVLDRTIRPALQRDGGDLSLIRLEDGNKLFIHYEGACGSCPSATMGTLMIIRQILQSEYSAELEVYAE